MTVDTVISVERDPKREGDLARLRQMLHELTGRHWSRADAEVMLGLLEQVAERRAVSVEMRRRAIRSRIRGYRGKGGRRV